MFAMGIPSRLSVLTLFLEINKPNLPRLAEREHEKKISLVGGLDYSQI